MDTHEKLSFQKQLRIVRYNELEIHQGGGGWVY